MAELAATAGDVSTEKISAKAEAKAEKAMAEVCVRSTTDATSTGGEKVATITSNTTGVAAPALRAGDRGPSPPARLGPPRILQLQMKWIG